jgi:hypothetical protein
MVETGMTKRIPSAVAISRHCQIVWRSRVAERPGLGRVIQCPRSGGGRQFNDLVPGGESGVHLVSVLGCGESVAAGSEVR